MVLSLGCVGAYAQSPTQDVYGGSGAGLVQAATASGHSQATVTQSGELPFTGLDVTYLGLAGLGLVGFGFVLRRTARKSE